MISRKGVWTGWMLGVFLWTAAWAAPSLAATTLVMGTGGPSGNYYKFGQLLADQVNKSSAQTGISIQVKSTSGSISNVKGLTDGSLQLGLVQADVAYMACKGKGPWAQSGGLKNLRTVYKLYTEAVTCVASADSGILTGQDLRGKRVALGLKDSGSLVNAVQALQTCWLKPSDLGQALYIGPNEAMKLMEQGKLDAFFFTVGHPSSSLRTFFARYRRARLVPFTLTMALKNNVPYYVKYFIWLDDYRSLKNFGSKLDTFGIKSFILTTDKVPPKVVYEITRTYLANLAYFKKRLPPMLEVEEPGHQTMRDLTWNLSAPFHDGVKQLGKEMGLF